MASYLLHQMTASCFVITMMKSKLLPAETNALVEVQSAIQCNILNGPEGSVLAATVDSLHLLHFGMRQLNKNTEKPGYRNIL